MKASKTMTTLAAAAMVSVIGLAYAQNSDSTLDPASTAQPAQTQPATVTDAMPAQSDTMSAPADQTATPADAATQMNSTATDSNAAPAAQPAPAADTSAPAYNTAPSDSGTQQPAPLPERAPRADRN